MRHSGRIIASEETDKLLRQEWDAENLGYIREAAESWGASRMQREYEPAIVRAKELGLQLYCAEFGCLPTVPRSDRLAYYRDIVGVFEANRMAWANWEYKGDFGLFQWHGRKGLIGAPDVELLNALFQR